VLLNFYISLYSVIATNSGGIFWLIIGQWPDFKIFCSFIARNSGIDPDAVVAWTCERISLWLRYFIHPDTHPEASVQGTSAKQSVNLSHLLWVYCQRSSGIHHQRPATQKKQLDAEQSPTLARPAAPLAACNRNPQKLLAMATVPWAIEKLN